LSRCAITESGIKIFNKELPNLKFLDLVGIDVKLPQLEEIKIRKPDLLLR
jgi:hypothetical protein